MQWKQPYEKEGKDEHHVEINYDTSSPEVNIFVVCHFKKTASKESGRNRPLPVNFYFNIFNTIYFVFIFKIFNLIKVNTELHINNEIKRLHLKYDQFTCCCLNGRCQLPQCPIRLV